MPSRLLQVRDEAQDLGLDRDVERGRGFVRDDHPRLAGERQRDHRPLAHAAGELMRILAARLSGSGICTRASISSARCSPCPR